MGRTVPFTVVGAGAAPEGGMVRAADGAVELVLFVSDPTRLGSNGEKAA